MEDRQLNSFAPYYYLMGSSQNKDPALRIFITLAKRVYIAGEMVQGVVHLDCTASRQYKQLYIKLNGSERVHWQEHHDKHTDHYNNLIQTYKEEFVLANFNMGIQPGQYSFPFSLAMPSTLPASFQRDGANYIKYLISAYLPAFDNDSTTQLFEKSLHIREPCRIPQKIFSITGISHAECCGCCCVCGTALLSLESEVDLYQNKPFFVKGIVDNTNGTTHIKSFKVVIRECLKRISQQQRINVYSNDFILYQSQNQVPIGASYPFQTQAMIPTNFLNYSAIGNIIYRAHFLDVVADVNCCYSDPRLSGLVIINNDIQPPLQNEQAEQSPPQGWNPIVSEPITFLNLRPYVHRPWGGIDVFNQMGSVNPMANMAMGTAASMNNLTM